MLIEYECSFEGLVVELVAIIQSEPEFDYHERNHLFYLEAPLPAYRDKNYNAIWSLPRNSYNASMLSKKYARGRNITRMDEPDLDRIIGFLYDDYVVRFPRLFDMIKNDRRDIPSQLSGVMFSHYVLFDEWFSE